MEEDQKEEEEETEEDDQEDDSDLQDFEAGDYFEPQTKLEVGNDTTKANIVRSNAEQADLHDAVEDTTTWLLSTTWQKTKL